MTAAQPEDPECERWVLRELHGPPLPLEARNLETGCPGTPLLTTGERRPLPHIQIAFVIIGI